MFAYETYRLNFNRYKLINRIDYISKKNKAYNMHFKLFYNENVTKISENRPDSAYTILTRNGFRDGNGQITLNMDQILLMITKSYVISNAMADTHSQLELDVCSVLASGGD